MIVKVKLITINTIRHIVLFIVKYLNRFDLYLLNLKMLMGWNSIKKKWIKQGLWKNK